MQALVFALPFVNLWFISVVIVLCAFINVRYSENQIFQWVVFFVFGICSLLLSFMLYFMIGFFCLQLNVGSFLLVLGGVLVSFSNYAVTIYNFDSRYKVLLLFVLAGYLFIALLMVCLNMRVFMTTLRTLAYSWFLERYLNKKIWK